MPRRRSTGTGLPSSAEVNITSLVDIAFTLLVIFIIAAPVLQGGIEVAVPEADVPPITQAEDPVFVDMSSADAIYVQEEGPFTREEFRTAFPQLAEIGEFEHVYFRADSTIAYGAIMDVQSMLYLSGISWAAVAAPERSGG